LKALAVVTIAECSMMTRAPFGYEDKGIQALLDHGVVA